MRKPNFIANTVSFELLRDEVGIGSIFELTPKDASLIVPHVESHPETLYIACSGVDVGGGIGSLFLPDDRKVAIEWIREEGHPNVEKNEPEANMYRYIFGLTSQGQCIGYEEYDFHSTASNQQVGDHWMSLKELCNHYPFQ